MNEIQRDQTFSALLKLSRRYPHWRIGQLVANVAGWADAEIWDVVDEQLLRAAQLQLKSNDQLEEEFDQKIASTAHRLRGLAEAALAEDLEGKTHPMID